MKRWLVTFRSHADSPADVHLADVTAPSMLHALKAVKDALAGAPFDWVLARAVPWPARFSTLDAAARSRAAR